MACCPTKLEEAGVAQALRTAGSDAVGQLWPLSSRPLLKSRHSGFHTGNLIYGKLNQSETLVLYKNEIEYFKANTTGL